MTAKLAQDNIALAKSLGAPVAPCTQVLAFKGYTIIAEAMKYH